MAAKKRKKRSNRNANRGEVLRLLATGEAMTRGDLVEKTGLSKMGISKIIHELGEAGLVSEGESLNQASSGRPPMSLGIADQAPQIVGILVQRYYVEAVLCDLDLRIVKRSYRKMPKEMSSDELKHLIYSAVDEVMKEEPSRQVIALGLSSIGPLSVSEGTIVDPLYFYNFGQIPLVQWLEERYQLPVYLENDNQNAVLVEHLFGCGRGYHDILFIGISDGVGSGHIHNDHLYSNQSGISPEFGHISIDHHGKLCRCGRQGCIEMYLRTPEIEKDVAQELGQNLTIEEIMRNSKHPKIKPIIDQTIQKLADAIVNLLNIMHCDLVILGNDGCYWQDENIEELSRQVDQKRFTRFKAKTDFSLPYFGQDAALLGAACKAVNALFDGEIFFT